MIFPPQSLPSYFLKLNSVFTIQSKHRFCMSGPSGTVLETHFSVVVGTIHGHSPAQPGLGSCNFAPGHVTFPLFMVKSPTVL